MQRLERGEQVAALAVLDYVRSLFTESPREQFSRDEVLVVLTDVMGDDELFEPVVQEVFGETSKAVEADMLEECAGD